MNAARKPRLLIATLPPGAAGPQRHVDALIAHAQFAGAFEPVAWAVADVYRGVGGKRRLLGDVRRHACRFDAFYTNVDLSLAFWLALAWRLAGGRALVVHSHNARYGSPDRPALRALFAFVVGRLADARLAVSALAIKPMFGAEAHVELLPSLIDFDALIAARDQPTGHGGVSAGMAKRLTFAVVGRLDEQKNQRVALAALARLGERGVDAQLLLIGDGGDLGVLQALAAELGIRDRVGFVGEVDAIAPWLAQRIDVLLIPSAFEGQCRVLAEAQALNVPVLAAATLPTDAALSPLGDVEWGLALNAGAWADAMARVARRVDPGARALRRSRDPEELARQRMSLARGASVLIDVIASAIERPEGR